ncbi:hypothetical protein QYF36_027080 [Acer negundo]|nr:hypothetical protein QYF36_027080 [Acer negundo]
MNCFRKTRKITTDLKETKSVMAPVSMVLDDEYMKDVDRKTSKTKTDLKEMTSNVVPVSMVVDDEYMKDVDKSRQYLRVLLHEHNRAIDMVRLAWFEVMAFVISKNKGPNSSIRKTRKTTTDLKKTVSVVVPVSMVVDDEYMKDVDKSRQYLCILLH